MPINSAPATSWVSSTLVGAPFTVFDGVVGEGYGPNLVGLVGPFLPSAIPLPAPPFPEGLFGPATKVLAGGLFNALGVDITPTGILDPRAVATLTVPGFFATLQGLVDQLLNLPEPVPVEVISFSSIETTDTIGGDDNGDGVTTGGGGEATSAVTSTTAAAVTTGAASAQPAADI